MLLCHNVTSFNTPQPHSPHQSSWQENTGEEESSTSHSTNTHQMKQQPQGEPAHEGMAAMRVTAHGSQSHTCTGMKEAVGCRAVLLVLGRLSCCFSLSDINCGLAGKSPSHLLEVQLENHFHSEREGETQILNVWTRNSRA